MANKNKPFFLYLPLTLPHAALQAPDADVQYYVNLFQEKPMVNWQGGYVPTVYPLSTYAAMISYLDKQVGIIEAQLKQLGLEQNTIVMFSSDNGPASSVGVENIFFNSAGSLRGRKQDVYEGGIREPFLAKWPGKIPAGKVNDHVSATYDMLATFADLLNVKAPENDGISLLPTLLGDQKAQKQHEYLYWEYPEKGGQLAIRLGNWKAVKTGLLKNPATAWQLYDLASDPQEKSDVAGQHPEILNQAEAIVKKEHTTPVRTEWDIFKIAKNDNQIKKETNEK
jgi:arylsulfatase A